MQVPPTVDSASRRRLLPDSFPSVEKTSITSSSIRLSTDDQINETTILRITHRVDIAEDDYLCEECGARASGEGVILPRGKPANSVLLRFTFNSEEQILQKHYSLQVYAGDVKVKSRKTVVTRSEKSLNQVYGVTVVEQSGWLKDQNLRTLFETRRLFEPFPRKINEIFNAMSVILLTIIFVLVVVFVACFVKACIDEQRMAGYVQ